MTNVYVSSSWWIWLSLLGIVCITSCRGSRVSTTPTSSETDPTADEAFDTFYTQFMNDSAFQMERIQFPLPGQKFTEEIEDSTYRWPREEWRVLSEPQIDPSNFTRNLQVSDTLATDEITGMSTGFYFKMVYRPVGRKWHLVYLVDRDL